MQKFHWNKMDASFSGNISVNPHLLDTVALVTRHKRFRVTKGYLL